MRLTVANNGSQIVRCGSCGFPNAVALPADTEREVSPPSPVAPVALPHQPVPVSIPNPRPVVIPASAPAPTPSPIDSFSTGVTGKNEVGWLVVHDENAALQTFPLRVGRQIIGRHNSASPCDIMIVTQDAFMSRNHCILEVKPVRAGGYDYLVSDRKMTTGRPENMSTNGTFVNAFQKGLQPDDVVYLNDGDTIQVGQTKLVIKTIRTVANSDDATRLVKDSEYSPTVIIRN